MATKTTAKASDTSKATSPKPSGAVKKTATKTTNKKATTSKRTTAPKKQKVIPTYTFPAIEGIQSGRLYYSAMIPISVCCKIFEFTMRDCPPELREQRKPKTARINKLKAYILQGMHKESIDDFSNRYFLPSVTITINCDDKKVDFKRPVPNMDVGILEIPMDAEFHIADGQHRIFAMMKAIEEYEELADETLSISIYFNLSKESKQQIFCDLNLNVSKPPSSLSLLYDHRNDSSLIAKAVKKQVPVFERFTDCEQTSCGKKSFKAFTLNGIEAAVNKHLFGHDNYRNMSSEDKITLAVKWFTLLTEEIPDWKFLLEQKVSASELRTERLSCHALTLCALGDLGLRLMKQGQGWEEKLKALKLSEIDWNRSNQAFEDLIIFGGNIRKNATTIQNFGEWFLEQADK